MRLHWDAVNRHGLGRRWTILGLLVVIEYHGLPFDWPDVNEFAPFRRTAASAQKVAHLESANQTESKSLEKMEKQ